MTVKDDENKCKNIANVILTSELDGQVCIFYFKSAKENKMIFYFFEKARFLEGFACEKDSDVFQTVEIHENYPPTRLIATLTADRQKLSDTGILGENSPAFSFVNDICGTAKPRLFRHLWNFRQDFTSGIVFLCCCFFF